jgi:hypothetical protein
MNGLYNWLQRYKEILISANILLIFVPNFVLAHKDDQQ